MCVPSLILETITIKRSMCEHNGVLKCTIRHLYPCEMKKATMTSQLSPSPAETGIKTLSPLTSYDPKLWSNFYLIRHKLQRVQ